MKTKRSDKFSSGDHKKSVYPASKVIDMYRLYKENKKLSMMQLLCLKSETNKENTLKQIENILFACCLLHFCHCLLFCACCSLLFTCCSLFFGRYHFYASHYFLLIACYFLLVVCYVSLVANS